MVKNLEKELVLMGLTDAVWLEHRSQIEKFVQVISSRNSPRTREGRRLLKQVSNNRLFAHFPRFVPIHRSILTMIELDEIAKIDDLGFFAQPINQKVIIRGLGIIVEDAVKQPIEYEEVSYNHYKDFLKNMSTNLRKTDERIQKGGSYRDIIDVLASYFLTSIETAIKSYPDFTIDFDSIRGIIRRDLSLLSQGERKKIFEALP